MSVLKTWQIHKNSTPTSVLDMILCLSIVKPSLLRWMGNTWQETGVFPFRAWSLLDCISANEWELQWLCWVGCGPLHTHLSTNLSCILGELAAGTKLSCGVPRQTGRSTNDAHLQNLLKLWHWLFYQNQMALCYFKNLWESAGVWSRCLSYRKAW